MRVTITSGSPRPKPKTGDVRTTKKHGLQIRVPEMHQIGNDDWAYVVMNGRQRYEWKTPRQLVGTRWEHLTVRVDGKVDSVANIARNETK